MNYEDVKAKLSWNWAQDEPTASNANQGSRQRVIAGSD